MAYRRKKTYRKKRVMRRTRRIKKVRRVKRRRVNDRQITLTETIDLIGITLDANAVTTDEFITLQKFPRALLMSNLYNEYKIVKAINRYVPRQSPEAWLRWVSSVDPLRAVSWNDSTRNTNQASGTSFVTSFVEALHRPGARQHSLLKPIVNSYIPMTRNIMEDDIEVTSNLTSAPARNVWLPTRQSNSTAQNSTVRHYGRQFYWPKLTQLYPPTTQPDPTPSKYQWPGFTRQITIVVQFRGKYLGIA